MDRIRLWTVTGFFSFLALVLSPAIHAQQDTWTGGGGDSSWGDGSNWSLTSPPSTSGYGYFSSVPSAGTTTISLGGAQSAGGIEFDTSAVPTYTIGSSSDTLTLSDSTIATGVGAIGVTSTVANPQAVNAAIAFTNVAPTVTNASATAGLTLGSSGSPSTITTASGTTSLTFSVGSGANIAINSAINGGVGTVTPVSPGTSSGGLQLQMSSSGTGTVALNSSSSTYSGATNLNSSQGTLVLQIGASSVLSGPTLVSGPFGTTTLYFNGNSTQSDVQAVGAARTVANPFVFVSGETFNNAATPQNLTFTGAGSFISNSSRTITFTNTTTTPYTVTFGSAANSATFALASTTLSNCAFDVPLNMTLVLNDTITNTGSATDTVSFNSAGNNTSQGTALITGANTYSGTTTINGQTSGTLVAQTIQIGSSSVGNPGSITSGPFGKGTLITNGNSSAPPILEPFGADQTVANAITMTSGFFVQEPTSTQDPTEPHNLTLTGPIANSGKVLTNNLPAGVALTLGSAVSPSTMTLTGTATFQSQAAGAGVGQTIINELISGAQAVNFKTGGTFFVNNASNSYSGGTSAIGVGTSSSAVGTGATLAGTGNVGGSGTVTISSATSGSYGGIVSPGNGSSPGTLNVPSMAWDRYGQYTFEYNPSSTSSGNDLINGSGSLSLADLSNGDFNINLVPANSNTPLSGPQTYELAVFGTGGITGLANLSDFTFSGTYNMASTPTVSTQTDPGNSALTDVILTFTPSSTPEPSGILLLGAAGVLSLRRKRR